MLRNVLAGWRASPSGSTGNPVDQSSVERNGLFKGVKMRRFGTGQGKMRFCADEAKSLPVLEIQTTESP